ncbi:MAG TPA: tetratricopeptide repeat protein [Longimicrobium sp.]|nr:tetratricopeptide repeat protein [Longimicrobium sp.]
MADLSPELTARIQSLEGSYADNPGRYFVALAGAWREAGETGRAEEILRENLKRFPGLSAHVLLGRCLADRGAFQEAANEFHYVLSIDAQNLIALRTLAEMAAAGGRRAEAEKWYNELLAVDPMNAEARVSLQELARGGADAAVADQPVQLGTGWGGASEPLASAGGADAGDADEFGMIDLSTPEASAADASGVAADDDAGEWGDLPFDIPSTSEAAPTSASSSDFDALGFGSVDLSGEPAETDETGAVGAWLDADARQDLGESAAADRGALAPLDADDGLLDAPLAGADLPFLDTDDTVSGDDLPLLDTDHTIAGDDFPRLDADNTVAGDELPLLDADHTVPAGLPPLDADPAFPSFEAPSHGDGFPAFSPAPAGGPPSLPAFDADMDDDGHPDHPVDAEVVTETMAELYAAQGLLQQSADTYRELIRQRGDEPGLVRRLAEIEARLHPAAEAPVAEEEEEEEAPDWLASVDEFAMGGAAADLAAVHMSVEPEPAAEEAPVDEPVHEPDYATAAVIADFPAEVSADDDLASPEPAFAEAAPLADFAPIADFTQPPMEAAAASDDPFADSFAGGFEGTEAPEPASAAAPVGSGDADREPWQAPSVSDSDAVGFDLIVVEEDGEEVAAPPEVVADVSADWAIAAAPLEDDEEAAEEERAAAAASSGARASSMRAYFSSLLAWAPGQSAAIEPEPAAEAPTFDATPSAEPVAADEPWTESPAADEPSAAAEPWSESPAAEPVAADEPWSEAPAAPSEEAPVDPWAESPAAPISEAQVYDDAPSAEDAPAEPATAEDEPWAASAPEVAPDAAPPAGESDIPLFDLDAEPWAEAPRVEPPSIDSFELSDEIASPASSAEPEEALPWELPAEPSTAPTTPAADASAGGEFSFEDFFAGGGAEPAPAETPVEPEPTPEPEPEPELPSAFVPSAAFEPVAPPEPAVTPPPAAPAAPAASAPAGGQDEDDEDLESFQAWLQSLKR